MYGSAHSDLGADVAEAPGLTPGTQFQVAIGTEDHLLHEDGSPAEKLREVFLQHAAPRRDGVYQQCAEFDGTLPTQEGTNVPIRALTWREPFPTGRT